LTYIVVLLFFAALVPQLALSPQNGDGAEQVMTALLGGVLHPPGFPVQAWLNRIFILLPYSSPSWRIALISLLGHSGAVYFLLRTFEVLKVSWSSRLFGSLAFGFFPLMSVLGLEPEVFGMAQFFMSLLIYESVRSQVDLTQHRLRTKAIRLSGLFALALGQHPITVISAPAVVWGLTSLLKREKKKQVQSLILFSLFSFGTVLALLYFSLPALRTDSAWPDWGKLGWGIEIIYHALRIDYGTFALTAPHQEQTLYGILVFLKSTFRYWNVSLIFAVIGVFSIFGIPKKDLYRRPKMGILATLALSLVFIARLQVPLGPHADPLGGESVLSRFFSTALIPLSIFLGLGFERFRSQLIQFFGDQRIVRISLSVIAVIGISSIATFHFLENNPRDDQTFELFREGLKIGIKPESFYFTQTDIESFYGIPTGQTIRFPVVVGVLGLPWYQRQVLPKVEPRLLPVIPGRKDLLDLLQTLYEQNNEVISTDPGLFSNLNHPYELRGFYFAIHPRITSNFTRESLEAAVQFCPIISRLKPLTQITHGASRELWNNFVRPFQGGLYYLEGTAPSRPEVVADLKQIISGLEAGNQPETWISGCQKLIHHFK
jgi:hypothetical protein